MSEAPSNQPPTVSDSQPPATAIILAGGGATRLGQDKAAALAAGIPLLQHVLAALPADVPPIVVGPPTLDLPAGVLRVQEVPAGGGPVAGLSAGLNHVRSEYVMLLAVDMPLGVAAAGAALDALSARRPAGTAAGRVEAMIPTDDRGWAQPLCAAFQTSALRRAIGGLPGADGAAMRTVVARLQVEYLDAVPAAMLMDVDEPADLVRVDEVMRGSTGVAWSQTREDGCTVMDAWIAAASAELGLDGDVDVDVVLDVARDVAHGVERPAAPVSTFLLGLAVGRGETLEQAAGTLTRLAATWNQA